MQLSRLQYMRGVQCPKAPWLFKCRQELAAEPDARRQHLFDTGHRVGELAQQLFPGEPDLDYKNLAIQSGGAAMDVFPRLREIDDAGEKAAIREALLAYCRLDALAMVKIREKLRQVFPA